MSADRADWITDVQMLFALGPEASPADIWLAVRAEIESDREATLDALVDHVEGLEGQCHDGEGLGCSEDPCVENVSRADVIAAIRGSDPR